MNEAGFTRDEIFAVAWRFLSHVDAGHVEECWPWRLSLDPDGYGLFSFRRRRVLAHRFAWALANGCDLPRGLVVMHACDNPPCCNPNHVRDATQLENIADRVAKGRSASGRKPRPPQQPGAAYDEDRAEKLASFIRTRLTEKPQVGQ